MKNIKNYLFALIILSLHAQTFPLRGRVAAFAVGSSVGRNSVGGSYDLDVAISKNIKRHESEIKENKKELKKLRSKKNFDTSREAELQRSTSEHEAAIQTLLK